MEPKNPTSKAGNKAAASQKKKATKVAKQALHRVQPGLLKTENDYLRTLVDPEKYRGYRYPDSFAGETAVTQGIINHNAYYFPADATLTPSAEAPGFFLDILSPTMLHPVLEYRMTTFAPNAYLGAKCLVQTQESGVFPLSEDSPSPSVTSGQMVVPTDGTQVNLRGYWGWSDQDFELPPCRFLLTDGTAAYGIPFSDQISSASTYDVIFSASFCRGLTTNTTVTLTAIGRAGASVSATYTAASAVTNMSVVLNLYPLLNVLANGEVSAGLPGIGFRMAIDWGGVGNANNINILMQSFEIQFRNSGGARTINPPYTNRFTTVDYPSEQYYVSGVDKYRVVSQSAWMEYEGSDFQNGGQIACLYYGGGQSPFANGLYDYSYVAEVPESYQGGLMTGSYTWWWPSDPRDMLFRRLNPADRWSLPYIVNIGYVATPTQINALRLRIPTNFELMSTDQIYEYMVGKPRPDLIAHACEMLRHFPHSTENPEHKEEARKLLDSATKKALGVGEWVANNAGWIAPALGGLAALI